MGSCAPQARSAPCAPNEHRDPLGALQGSTHVPSLGRVAACSCALCGVHGSLRLSQSMVRSTTMSCGQLPLGRGFCPSLALGVSGGPQPSPTCSRCSRGRLPAPVPVGCQARDQRELDVTRRSGEGPVEMQPWVELSRGQDLASDLQVGAPSPSPCGTAEQSMHTPCLDFKPLPNGVCDLSAPVI